MNVWKCWKQRHGGGRKDGHLLAVAHGFERGAHDDFGLAVAHIAAEQAVHRLRAFHVALDIGDGGFLIARFAELESVFELPLPVTVGRKRESGGQTARSVELEQLFRHVAHLALDAGARAAPGGPAHPVESGFGFAFAAKALHQIHARQRHIELVAARVFDQHVIAFGIALGDLANAEELADAVLEMHHVVARLQIELIRGEGSEMRFAGPGDSIRGFEEILRAEDGEPALLEDSAGATRRRG